VRVSNSRLWLGLVALGAALIGLVTLGLLGNIDAGARDALEQRGRVLGPAGAPFMAWQLPGTRFEPLESAAAVKAAANGSDGAALAQALRAASVDTLAVVAAPRSTGRDVLSRLARYDHVDGLRGLYLSTDLALYTHDVASELSPQDRAALLGVARGLLAGARPPRATSFPEPLRRLRHVEVMLLLRQGPRARLWRSARGSSLARALITAATVARERWIERAQAMGGPLETQLPSLTVEVSLLQDDGTLGLRDAAFLRLAFKPEHGVGFEHKGAWRYLLPELMTRYATPMDAYAALFDENGYAADMVGAPEVRLYRTSVSLLVSGPAVVPPPDDGLSEVGHPDEVLPR